MMIKVRVTPNAKKCSFTQDGDLYKIKVDAPATEGKANAKLLKIIAKHFDVKPSDVSIISGIKSRDKTILIAGK